MHLLVVSLGHFNRPVHDLEDVFPYQAPLAKNANSGAIAAEDIPVAGELLELHLRHLHEPIDLVLRAVEVLDAEGVDCDRLYTTLVANL